MPLITPKTAAEAAIELLTAHELSPSTVDLLTLQGIQEDVFFDAGEKYEIIDALLSRYEAQTVEAGEYDPVPVIVTLRRHVQVARDV